MNKPAFIKLHYVVGTELHPVLVNVDNIVDVAHTTNDKSIANAIVYFGPDQYYAVIETFEKIESTIASYTSILEVKD